MKLYVSNLFSRVVLFVIFFSGLETANAMCRNLAKHRTDMKEVENYIFLGVVLAPIGVPLGIYEGYSVYQIRKLGRLIEEVKQQKIGPVTKNLLKSLSKIDPGNTILTLDEIRLIVMKLNADPKDGFCTKLRYDDTYDVRPGMHYRAFKSQLKEMIRLKSTLTANKPTDFDLLDEQD